MKYSLLGVALMMSLLSACGGQQQEGSGSNNMAPPASGTASGTSDTHSDAEHEQPNPNEGSSGE